MLSSDPHNETDTHTHTHIRKDIYIYMCKKWHCLATQWASPDNFENTHCACLHLWSQISQKLPELMLLAFNMIRILGRKKDEVPSTVTQAIFLFGMWPIRIPVRTSIIVTEAFCVTSQPLQTKFRTSPDIMPRPVPSCNLHFITHCDPVIRRCKVWVRDGVLKLAKMK